MTCVSNSHASDAVSEVDFGNRNAIGAALDTCGVPDVFIHLGWEGVYEPQADVHVTTNVKHGVNLVDELYDRGTRTFVLIGSSSEYGDRKGLLSEDLQPAGVPNNYVKGKLALARYGFDAAARFGRTFLHVRLFYTFGAGQRHDSLINQLYKSYVERAPLELSPCEHYRDYIHISDAVEGIERISRVDESAIVNLGSGSVVQLRKFIERFWAQLGGDPGLLKFGAHKKPAHEPTQPCCYADLSRLKRLTDWVPALAMEDGIRRTILDLRDA